MTRIRSLRRTLPAALVAAALLTRSGSDSPGTVTGKVTLNQKPLKSGLITFESEVGNKDAFSAAIRDGVYATGPIPSGPCQVTVIHSAVPAKPSEEVGGNDLGPPHKPGARSAPEVPEKDHRSDTSGLDYTVKPRENTHDVEL